ncbi:flowering-promoting factor 1-like protein 1 [Tasmannia lanceolata]|uniref:flowering-promoting factor 1-like protein 1 n=1 Tax=Tasmannia lanceolata TaxID=3420 RepID=UPI0040634394
MSGVWVFKDNVIRLVENPASNSSNGNQPNNVRRKVLVWTPTNEVITSYTSLESKLAGLGWERYSEDPNILQFHKQSSVHLISIPRDFAKFNSVHMYDIVVKNKDKFKVKDV